MFKLGDYYTRFYSSSEGNSRSKYGSIAYIARVIKRDVDKIILKKYHIPFDYTEISPHSKYYLVEKYSLGGIRKSTSSEIFRFTHDVCLN